MATGSPGPTSAYWRWTLATALILITHALLDGMTVYGTQLWLPFYTEAVGLGSVFIIDPLYTLPLLLSLFASLITKKAWLWQRTLGRTDLDLIDWIAAKHP
jgi:inner membrane protein